MWPVSATNHHSRCLCVGLVRIWSEIARSKNPKSQCRFSTKSSDHRDFRDLDRKIGSINHTLGSAAESKRASRKSMNNIHFAIFSTHASPMLLLIRAMLFRSISRTILPMIVIGFVLHVIKICMRFTIFAIFIPVTSMCFTLSLGAI